MDSKSQEGPKGRDPKKPRRVAVFEQNERGIPKGQIAVIVILALIVIGAIAAILYSYDPYIRP